MAVLDAIMIIWPERQKWEIQLTQKIKLLIENKLIICALGTRIAQVFERQAINPEVRGLNPGSGSNFSLEI